MTGFCGVVGHGSGSVEMLTPALHWTGAEGEQTFTDRRLSVGDVHRPDDGGRPVETGDGDLLWVWGTVFGYENDDGNYESRPPGETTTDYCARLCERDGLDFITGLNGHHFGVVYDRTEPAVRFFTDRLGTVDAYYATPADGVVVFSSHLQALPRWPGVSAAVDVDSLAEFFTYTRSMGVETPLADVSLFPPASVLAVDGGTVRDVERYWRPRHRPVDASFSQFVDEFVRRFRAALADRTSDPGNYGLLLSGGSDSRIVAAALDGTENVTAYHATNWMSREAQTAERVALTAGLDFSLLERDEEYLSDQLDRTPALSNAQGKFTQAQFEGFLPEIRTEVDYLIDGLYGDILFGGWGIPQRRLPLGPLGRAALPVARSLSSVDDYIEMWDRDIPPYVRSDGRMRDILEENIVATDDGVSHHGVHLDSPVELLVWSHVFPQTNMGGGFQIRSVRQHLPYRNPMLDNRLLDLSLSMPLNYLLRRNVVDAAIERLAPDLAALSHSSTGVPLDSRYPLNWLREYATDVRRLLRPDDPPRRDLDHGPWEPHAEVIRVRDFVRETLTDHEELIRDLPFLDWEGALECYRDHLGGADNATELYMLVTFLEMPLAKRLMSASTESEQEP